MSKDQRKSRMTIREALNKIDFGHEKPKTRRELFASGLLASTGAVFTPSLFSLLAKKAYGQECDVSGGGPAKVADVYQIHLAGGFQCLSNFVPGKLNDQTQFLPTAAYELISGMPASMSPDLPGSTVNLGDLLMWSKSGIYTGLANGCTPETLAAFNGVLVTGACGENDNGDNSPVGVVQMLASLGISGNPLDAVRAEQEIVGNGGRNFPAYVPLGGDFSMQDVSSYADAVALLDAGPLATVFPNRADQSRIMAAAEQMSAVDLAKYSQSTTLSQQMADFVKCVGAQTTAAMARDENNDPRLDADLQAALQINNPQNNGINVDQNLGGAVEMVSSICTTVSSGRAGAGVIKLSDFDIHQLGDRQDQLDADAVCGRVIALLAETSRRKGQDCVIFLTTDNANRCDNINGNATDDGLGKFNNDDGYAGMAMLICSADGTKPVINGPTQIGGVSDSGALEGPYAIDTIKGISALIGNFADRYNLFNQATGLGLRIDQDARRFMPKG